MRKLRLLYAAIFCFSATNLFAQENPNSVEFAPYIGFKMFSVKPYEMAGTFWGFDAAYHLNMEANKADWVRMMRLKNISFSFTYRHMDAVYLTEQPGSDGFLGHNFGLTTRLNILVRNFGKDELRFTPGCGFAYTSTTFSTNNNPLVGSHINFAMQAGIKYLHPLSATTRLTLGIDLYHFSNAGVKLPNDGVNSLNGSIGLDHDINQMGPKTAKDLFKFKNKSSVEFGFNIGRRGLPAGVDGVPDDVQAKLKTDPSRLYQSGFYLGYSYRVSQLFSLKVGSDAVWYYTPYDKNNFFYTFESRGTSYDRWNLGAALGFDIWMGRVAFEANYGHYIHFNSFYNEPFYWTFGGKYFFTHWLAFEPKLYFNGTEANFAGFGLMVKI